MIRPARATDAIAIAALVERAYAPWVVVLERRPSPMDEDHTEWIENGESFVLEHGEAIVGVVEMTDEGDRLWLDNIAVEPALHGQGHGRTLLAFVESEARRRDLPCVALLTNERMIRNIALYLRLGYAETDRRTDEGFSRVFMSKRLA